MSEETVVDARGLACPFPVVKTKKAIEDAGPGARVTAIVDNEAARDNVTRMARNAGCEVTVENDGPGFRLLIEVGAEPDSSRGAAIPACAPAPTLVAYVNKDTMGHGDEELGGILMKAFLQTLEEVEPRPGSIVFVNSGVFLTTRGSKFIPLLKNFEEKGIKIISCGTCLDYFKRAKSLEVGIVSNMYEIVSLLAGADRVVSP